MGFSFMFFSIPVMQNRFGGEASALTATFLRGGSIEADSSLRFGMTETEGGE